jgi:hypothetical protein
MSLRDAVLDALEIGHSESSAAATHEIIARALNEVDPTLQIEPSGYFTHSFVPDLVISWGPESARVSRPVHLRFSVTDEAFPADLRHLDAEAPIFIGLTDDPDAEPDADSSSESLVTQTPGLSELVDGSDHDSRARVAHGQVVRSGTGPLSFDRAHALSQGTTAALTALDQMSGEENADPEPIRLALDLLDDLLPSASLASIERGWQRLWILHGGDPSAFPGQQVWQPDLLPEHELGEILNALLDAEFPPESASWRRYAGHLDIDGFGRAIGRNRVGGNLDLLARALLASWTAQWAWAERLDPSEAGDIGWVVRDERLGLQAGGLRVLFANDGRRARHTGTSSQLPSLEAVNERLRGMAVSAIELTSGDDYLAYGGPHKPDDEVSTVGEEAEAATEAETIEVDDSLDAATESALEGIAALLVQESAARYKVTSASVSIAGTQVVARLDFRRLHLGFGNVPMPIARIARLALAAFSGTTRGEADLRRLLGD